MPLLVMAGSVLTAPRACTSSGLSVLFAFLTKQGDSCQCWPLSDLGLVTQHLACPCAIFQEV
jgi:hypothetical protein